MRKIRSLLSVLLVCCLLVNVVPVKSKAVGATAAVVGVSVAMVAASALIGLGVSPGEDRTVFDGLVQDAVDALSTAGYVAGGLINVFSPANGGFKYGISQVVLKFIRNWLFDSSLGSSVIREYSAVLPNSISNDETIKALREEYASRPYHLVSYNSETGKWSFMATRYRFVFTPSSFLENSTVVKNEQNTNIVCVNSDNVTSTNKSFSISNSNHCTFLKGYAPEGEDYLIEVSDGLSSNFIPSSALFLSDAYTDWASNSTTIPADEAGEDEDVIVYPIGLGPDYDNTISKPQEDVWAGTSEYEIEAEGDSEAGTGTETGLLSSILSAVKSIPSAFEGWFKDLIDLAGEIGEAIIGLPARIKDALTSLFQDVVNVGQAVVDAVLGIPQAIADVLTAIFVPDQAYVEAKVDAVYAQFPFIQSIIATGEELKGAVSGSSGPPVIYVDLGLAPSGDFGSQKVLLTDFSWYEPYKQRVDTLLSAALWALFGWRMYLRLPSIISGEGGIMIASERAYRKLGDD